ncbi:MAG: hypothetical protein ACKN9T_05835 [Candidatus Methylumidiphilus sp.]
MARFLASLLLSASVAHADVAVVVNAANSIPAPSPRAVQDIFLGRARAFADGRPAMPIDQSTALRAEFYQALTGRPLEQINAYWARLMFTGQATPPPQVGGDDAVLHTVRGNPAALGYVAPSRVDKSVRLLLLLKP